MGVDRVQRSHHQSVVPNEQGINGRSQLQQLARQLSPTFLREGSTPFKFRVEGDPTVL